MADKFKTYLDLGYNTYGINPVVQPTFVSASFNDAYSELGERSVTNAKVRSITADKISGGTISAVTNIGDDSIVLDGENKEIKIYDDLGNVAIYMKGGSAWVWLL